MWGLVLRLAAGLTLTMLAGCVHMSSDRPSTGSQAACCMGSERYPRWLVATAEPTGPITGRIMAGIAWRRGYLSTQADALARLTSVLSPLDIILVKHGGSFSSNNIPGHFSHAIVYLGPDRALQRLGVWKDGAANAYRPPIRSGQTMIEADSRGVHLSTPASTMNTDRVLVLRPAIPDQACRLRTTLALFAHLGTPFDFRFNSADGSRLFCTELIDHVAPELRLPSRDFYGRPTIFPDQLADAATRSGGLLDVVLYLKGDPTGWRAAGIEELKADIARAWSR
jgi:hypothetical protein